MVNKRFPGGSKSPYKKVALVPYDILEMLKKRCKSPKEEDNPPKIEPSLTFPDVERQHEMSAEPAYQAVPTAMEQKYGLTESGKQAPLSMPILGTEEYTTPPLVDVKLKGFVAPPYTWNSAQAAATAAAAAAAREADDAAAAVAALPAAPPAAPPAAAPLPPPPASTAVPKLKVFPCDHCNKVFTEKWKRTRHLRAANVYRGVRGTMEEGEAAREKWVFDKAEPPQKSLPAPTPKEKTFKCTRCGQVFPKKWTRDKHRMSVHGTKEKVNEKMDVTAATGGARAKKRKRDVREEEEDGASSSKKVQMASNKRKRDDKKPQSGRAQKRMKAEVIFCKRCKMTFASQSAMMKHLSVVHKQHKSKRTYPTW